MADTNRARARLPDEALYALALYIYSLQPPRNPNPFDEKAEAGQKIFTREGCPTCHTPLLYTSNKLTLAQGFTAPKDKPASLDDARRLVQGYVEHYNNVRPNSEQRQIRRQQAAVGRGGRLKPGLPTMARREAAQLHPAIAI